MPKKDPQFKIACSTCENANAHMPILLIDNVYKNLQTAYHIGYNAIEIHLRETAVIDFDRIDMICNTLGIRISALVTGKLCTEGKLTLANMNTDIQKDAEKGVLKYIEMAHRMKTDLVIGWIRGGIEPGDEPQKYYDRLADVLRKLGKRAREENVRLFMEVINRYEINTFNTTTETLNFINEYQIPNTYLHLDTFHMNIEEDDIVKAIRAGGEKLGYIHFADNTRRCPGTGTLDFKKIVKELFRINYKGYISVECLPNPTGEQAAVRALETIKTAITAL